jgi:hypothetical protein
MASKPIGQDLGYQFCKAVHKTDRSEIFHLISPVKLWDRKNKFTSYDSWLVLITLN